MGRYTMEAYLWLSYQQRVKEFENKGTYSYVKL